MLNLNKLNRADAIRYICQFTIINLSSKEREEILLNYIDLDENDVEFYFISEDVKLNLIKDYESIDYEDKKYDSLILEYLISSYKGILNSYILNKLHQININCLEIIGLEENLRSCPCCAYKTLDSNGEYDVCKVCFWEDDGNNDPLIYSNVNKITLGDAQSNFIEIGAYDKKALFLLEKNIIDKYAR
jgi:hypothetical protein